MEKETKETLLTEILKTGPKSNKELRQILHLDTGRHDPKLDRTLQKLRKQGVVKVMGSKWTVEDFEVCENCHGKGWVPKETK